MNKTMKTLIKIFISYWLIYWIESTGDEA